MVHGTTQQYAHTNTNTQPGVAFLVPPPRLPTLPLNLSDCAQIEVSFASVRVLRPNNSIVLH